MIIKFEQNFLYFSSKAVRSGKALAEGDLIQKNYFLDTFC